MTESECGENRLVSLKVLYTLHGVASQKFVVKPAAQVEARMFDASELGIVALKPCLDAIRHSSPDYAEICDSSANDYAIYSVDYAEEGLPLQGHGRVSEHVLKEVTGKLRPSKLLQEQLELQIHLLPIRVPPPDVYDASPGRADYAQAAAAVSASSHSLGPSRLPQDLSTEALQDDDAAQRHAAASGKLVYPFPAAPASLNFGLHFPQMPSLPESLHNSRPETFLPSSPPVRARPTKIASSSSGTVAPRRVNPMADLTPGKRSLSESATSAPKKKKQASPSSSSEAACGNCGVASASTWRRVHIDGPMGGDILLCNACGLYYKTKNIMRPSFLWDRSNRLASRFQEPQIARARSSKPAAKKSSAVSELDAAAGPQAAPETLSQDATDASSSPDTLPALADHESIVHDEPSVHDPSVHEPGARELSVLGRPLSANGGGAGSQREQREQHQHPLHLHMPEPPSTPPRGNRSDAGDSQPVPSSIEKLFLVTPDGKKTINIHLPGSGSAGKWLNRMMNPSEESSYFESFLASPTPKKNRGANRQTDSPICSSPPTSSTLFSEIPDWSVFPTSPTPPKLLPPAHGGAESNGRKDRLHINSTEPI